MVALVEAQLPLGETPVSVFSGFQEQRDMRIAVIAAHPDDAEIWCGGTIYKHAQRGDEVTIFTFFDHTPHRLGCAQRSATMLGAAHVACQDTTASNLDINYSNKLLSFRPDIILAHWHHDSHPHHYRANGIARESVVALAKANVCPRAMFTFTTYYNRGVDQIFLPEFYIDVSKEWPVKLSAIRLHDDQDPDEIINDITPLFGLHGRIISCEYAEVFREVPIFGRLKSELRIPELLR